MNKKTIYKLGVFLVILTALIFIMGIDRKTLNNGPITVYQVYLSGNKIGIIEDKDELYKLIDKEQEKIKKEYNVDKVYAPNDLEISKVVTYEGEVDDVKDVYKKVKETESFTIKGYEISIKRSEDDYETINVIHLEDFDKAVENTIKAFVGDKEYTSYIDGTQEVIKVSASVGDEPLSRIENIKIKEEITTKEKYISVKEQIFKDANELSKYLLFGTTEKPGVHTVRTGETIKEIANNYQLNVTEFLIVNPSITSPNALLYSGQEVNVGLVNPIIGIVVEKNLIEKKKVQHSKEVRYNDKLLAGTTYTEQKGSDGESVVSYYIETINGQMTQVVPLETLVKTPVINEVVVKGGLPLHYLGDTGGWYWPTNKPYVITSDYGYRVDLELGINGFHKGIDISGTGYGSPIYAAQTGTIISVGYNSTEGNYIHLRHNEEYVTKYMHLSGFASGISVNTIVGKGQVIGYMGNTGYSFGAHLHFQVEYYGQHMDPFKLAYN